MLYLVTCYVGDEHWAMAGVFAGYFSHRVDFGLWIYFLLGL